MSGLSRASVLALLASVAAAAGAVAAPAPQPPFDYSKLDFKAFGQFKAGDPIPSPLTPPAPTAGRRFNPSGDYIAYDSNVFSTLAMPFRAAGDTTENDPYGNGNTTQPAGDPRPGFCAQGETAGDDRDRPGNQSQAAGRCFNHQREWSKYYEETMQDILGDFGVTIRRYEFESPGSSNTQSGRAVNTAAVVPGADDPDEQILIAGHYDQTNDAPASGWDSAEGNAETIRAAKIMADYWRKTGTRPSATVKFIPWDAEESGLLGAFDYVNNVVVPGQEENVRGYYNVDPCAGGYPAFRRGNPLDRIPLKIQLANPDLASDPANPFGNGEGPPAGAKERITAFNATVRPRMEKLFDRLDEQLNLGAGMSREIFVSSSEAAATGRPSDIGAADGVQIGTEREILFTSDWVAFEEIGVPFINPAPAIAGPGTQGNQNQLEALQVFHNPMDNLTTVNRLTSADQTGQTVSEGWAKGMEMCSQLVSSFMLQPDQGGAQTANSDVVAYYEALPNEAVENRRVTFDADGSYQYAAAATRTKVPDADLEYLWDFGDGTTGTGRRVQHAYAKAGVYKSKLTVRNRQTGASSTMGVPITVTPVNFGGPLLKTPPARDDDGTFGLEWETSKGASDYIVEEARDARQVVADDAEAPLAGRYTASQPTQGGLEPWQPSDSTTPKFRGNVRSSGARSYWTGVSPANANPGPANAESVLTKAQPIDLPATNAEIAYNSSFRNEGDDQGFVEVGVTDSTGRLPTIWTAVDTVGGRNEDIYNPQDPGSVTDTGLERRRVDVSEFGNKRVFLRFRYKTGPDNRAASQPAGWYVDDIRVLNGTFAPIAEVADNKLMVRGRDGGRYAYRVRARFADGVVSKAGNVESVVVGAGGGTGGTGGTGGGNGPGAGGPGTIPGRVGRPCTDRTPPGRPSRTVRRRAGGLVLHGHTKDRGCAGVGRIEVVVARLGRKGSKCRFVKASGRLSRPRPCRRPIRLVARGTSRWSLKLGTGLPKGRYHAYIRSVDRAGNRGKTSKHLRFRRR